MEEKTYIWIKEKRTNKLKTDISLANYTLYELKRPKGLLLYFFDVEEGQWSSFTYLRNNNPQN